MTQKTRPVFLNLLRIHFPVTAIVSIGHRVSGVVLYLTMPLWFLLLDQVRHYGQGVSWFQALQHCPIYRYALWLALVAALYHIVAGLRHLWMDVTGCHSLRSGRVSSWVVLIGVALLSIIMGVRLW